MHFHKIFAVAAALAISASSYAHQYTVGDLHIKHPHARPTVPGQPGGAAYIGIENKGKDDDKLISVSSPIAKRAELHTMSMEGNVMKMREVATIAIAPATQVMMKPGDGYHIMLIGLTRPLKAGDKFPLTLTFEKAGKVEVSVLVEDKEKAASAAPDTSMQHTH